MIASKKDRLAANREAQRRYRESEKGKASRAVYRASKEGHAKRMAYLRSEKGKAQRAVYRASKEGKEVERQHSFQRHSGLSRAAADAMIEAQGGLCAICKEPPNGKGHHARLHVDHCHETGKIRAMLCGNCNTALGLMKDDSSRLQSAIDYLAKHISD